MRVAVADSGDPTGERQPRVGASSACWSSLDEDDTANPVETGHGLGGWEQKMGRMLARGA